MQISNCPRLWAFACMRTALCQRKFTKTNCNYGLCEDFIINCTLTNTFRLFKVYLSIEILLMDNFHKLPMTHIRATKSRSKDSSVNNGKESISGMSLHNVILRQKSTILNTLRRPIHCPITDCNKLIAMTQLVTHYIFEHARIPRDFLELNEPHTLGVSLNSMEYGKAHSIALLLIQTEKFENQQPTDDCIAFTLMAAKLRCNLLCHKENEKELDKGSSKEDGEQPMHNSDFVIFWMCGNVDENFRCLIEISDDSKCITYSRFGPINSFRDSNDPIQVFQTGSYLIVPASNVNIITRNGLYPIVLKTIVSFPS